VGQATDQVSGCVQGADLLARVLEPTDELLVPSGHTAEVDGEEVNSHVWNQHPYPHWQLLRMHARCSVKKLRTPLQLSDVVHSPTCNKYPQGVTLRCHPKVAPTPAAAPWSDATA
jgi:hypothetical protein